MMNSRDYWERRAAQRMYEDMKTAEDAADDIEKIYNRASRYIQMHGSEIFEKFRRDTGLSEHEAIRLLKHVKSPTDLDAVLEYISQIKEPAKRQAVIQWLNANSVQYRLSRLASLQQAIDNLIPLLYAEELKHHQSAYRKIIQDAFLHRIFDIQQFTGQGDHIAPLDVKQVERMMRERWLGSNYSSRLWGNTNRLAKAVRDELMVSFFTGRPQLEAWRAIDEEFKKGHHASRRLIRTESNYLANRAQLEAYKQSEIEKYIYVATLDLRTSETCRGLDGKTFDVDKAEAGKNYPPMHPWCRSTTIAWIPSQVLAKMKRDALDPKTGRHIKVPANMTYEEWHKRYVKSNRNTFLPKCSERNLTRIQYDNYRNRLGDNFEYSYDDFINMKSDKELWQAWQKSYKDSKRSDSYKDLTEVYRFNNSHATADVHDAKAYTAPNGVTYRVGDNGVLLDYDINNAEFLDAPILSRSTRKAVQMCPRVVYPERIKTPDYLVGRNEERWDCKGLHGSGLEL